MSAECFEDGNKGRLRRRSVGRVSNRLASCWVLRGPDDRRVVQLVPGEMMFILLSLAILLPLFGAQWLLARWRSGRERGDGQAQR